MLGLRSALVFRSSMPFQPPGAGTAAVDVIFTGDTSVPTIVSVPWPVPLISTRNRLAAGIFTVTPSSIRSVLALKTRIVAAVIVIVPAPSPVPTIVPAVSRTFPELVFVQVWFAMAALSVAHESAQSLGDSSRYP